MKAIAAISLNRMIGREGKLPWTPIKEDFKWFKKTTMGGKLLMGRTTFDSIGKPLPGRFTYILTNDTARLSLPPTDMMRYISKEYFLTETREEWDNMWICGGANVYEQFLPMCDELYLTIVLKQYEGDTLFPEFEHLFHKSETIQRNDDFVILRNYK